MVAPSVHGTPATGGRQGNGAFSVAAPAGAVSWLAYLHTPDGTTVITPATNFTRVYKSPLSGLEIYRCTGSPGSSWTAAGVGDAGAAVRAIVAGYTTTVAVGLPAYGASLSCGGFASGQETLVVRVLAAANSTDVAPGYPAAATLGRQVSRLHVPAFPANFVVAIAHQAQATAGSVAAASFTLGGTIYGAEAVSLALRTVPATPGALTATDGGDREVPVAFSASSGVVDGYEKGWRRTDLTPPAVTTQASPPWHLGAIADGVAGGSFPYTYKGDGVVVFVLDTGIRTTHDEYDTRLEGGTSFVATAWNLSMISHGSWVTSNAVGATLGPAKGAATYHLKVLPDDAVPGQSPNYTNFLDWVNLMIAVADGRPGVANFSLPVPGVSDPAYANFSTGLDLLEAAHITCVGAIGNSGTDVSAQLGAAHAKMILVGGTTSTNAWWSGSSWFDGIELAAPADNVVGADDDSDTDTQTGSGTSFASPIAAGVVALIKQPNPTISTARIKEMLRSQGWNVITGAPSGKTPVLVNSGTQTSGWSYGAAPGTTFGLDGLDVGASYEIKMRSWVDIGNGLRYYSAETASDTATTAGGASPVPMRVGGALVTEIRVGNKPVTAIYRGAELLWAA